MIRYRARRAPLAAALACSIQIQSSLVLLVRWGVQPDSQTSDHQLLNRATLSSRPRILDWSTILTARFDALLFKPIITLTAPFDPKTARSRSSSSQSISAIPNFHALKMTRILVWERWFIHGRIGRDGARINLQTTLVGHILSTLPRMSS